MSRNVKRNDPHIMEGLNNMVSSFMEGFSQDPLGSAPKVSNNYDLWMQQEAHRHEKEMFLLKNGLQKNAYGGYDRISDFSSEIEKSSSKPKSSRSIFGFRRKKR